jgi:hypothetical protein
MADNPAKFCGRNELDDKPNSPKVIYIVFFFLCDNDYYCILANRAFGTDLPN